MNTVDEENQLASVTVTNGVNDSTKSEFVYDGLSRLRIRKESRWQSGTWAQTAEVRYVYDGRLAVQERDGNNVPTVTYTRGLDLSGSREGAGGIGGLLARTDQTTISPAHAYYHADGNGNVTALINAQHRIAARYSYDPYGNVLAMSGPLAEANVYRFSSKEAHAASGLTYYLYRFYEPNLQRWINRDPIGERGGINLYGFVGNEPAGSRDPLGLACKDLPAGWHHYAPGAEKLDAGDWIPGHDLEDCRAAAGQRWLRRQLKAQLAMAIEVLCLPSLNELLEMKHLLDIVGEHMPRWVESALVYQLDSLACYYTWDPLHIPKSMFVPASAVEHQPD